MCDKTIICLAKSYKHGGLCIAGRELNGSVIGPWLRPVSSRPGHEISESELRYPDGRSLQLLQIVRVPLAAHAPFEHQPENHVINGLGQWELQGRASWGQLYQSQDLHDVAFWRDHGNTIHGMADKLPTAAALAVGSSLKFVQLERIVVSVRTEAGYNGAASNRKVRAKFDYEGTHYLLTVTDPFITKKYLELVDGDHTLKRVFVCISLSEVLANTGCAYRLVASIITTARFEEAE
jgi:hypothetical protein